MPDKEHYKSYLLRLWREGDGKGKGGQERQVWRASLQSPHSDRRMGFATLEGLFRFLRQQAGALPGEHSEGVEPTANVRWRWEKSRRPLLWLWRTLVVLVYLPLAFSRPTHTSQADEYGQVAELSHPITGYKLIAGLRGATRQADRIADAIAAFEINVHLLHDDHFEERYRSTGGERSASAFTYGNAVYMRTSSPTLLSDLVHEGTHALDYLSGWAMSRRLRELRAYYHERQFQRAKGVPIHFESLIEMVVFVCGRY